MLEFLNRWTPLAQFLGPLIAGLAAVFAARSAGVAREAARILRRPSVPHTERCGLDRDVVAELCGLGCPECRSSLRMPKTKQGDSSRRPYRDAGPMYSPLPRRRA